MPTTAFWKVRLRPVFPFTMSLRPRFAKPANLFGLSNYSASVSEANRAERFLADNAPCFYIGAVSCRGDASDSFQCIKRHFRKRHFNRKRQQAPLLYRHSLIAQTQEQI